MRVLSFSLNKMQNPQDCVHFNATVLPYPTGSESGLEEGMRRQVLAMPQAPEMVESAIAYLQESLDVAFGCVSGFQRSVALAEETARQARELGLDVAVEHLGLDDVFKEAQDE